MFLNFFDSGCPFGWTGVSCSISSLTTSTYSSISTTNSLSSTKMPTSYFSAPSTSITSLLSSTKMTTSSTPLPSNKCPPLNPIANFNTSKVIIL